MKTERYIVDNDKFYAEGFQGNKKKFAEIIEGVDHVFTRTVGELFLDRHGREKGGEMLGRAQQCMEWRLSAPTTIGALLRENNTGNIVGITYAFPSKLASNADLHSEEFNANNLSYGEREDILSKTVEVGWTAIREEHRGKGGWTLMMNSLELGLVSRKEADGEEYDYQTRFVRKDNGYAEKVRRRYGERIVYESSYNEPNFLGEQAYFRIKLDK